MVSISSRTLLALSASTKFKSQLIRMSVSSSVKEPSGTCKKWINSFSHFRAAPSVMLTGTGTPARLFCVTKPNRSSGGKELIT
jgi:hypothetical protein